MNPELVADVRAFGHPESVADDWRVRAAGANTGAEAAATAPGASTSATVVPPALFAVVLCVASVGVNHAAFAFGPVAGVGVATNLVGNLMNGDLSGAWFAIVQVVGAVVWGIGGCAPGCADRCSRLSARQPGGLGGGGRIAKRA